MTPPLLNDVQKNCGFGFGWHPLSSLVFIVFFLRIIHIMPHQMSTINNIALLGWFINKMITMFCDDKSSLGRTSCSFRLVGAFPRLAAWPTPSTSSVPPHLLPDPLCSPGPALDQPWTIFVFPNKPILYLNMCENSFDKHWQTEGPTNLWFPNNPSLYLICERDSCWQTWKQREPPVLGPVPSAAPPAFSLLSSFKPLYQFYPIMKTNFQPIW